VGKGKRNREKRRATARSPLSNDLRSFELKIARAQHHLDDVRHEVSVWTKAGEKTVTEGTDPEYPDAYGVWVEPPELPAKHISVLVSDCLQCFRTALDHLAFELATTVTSPLPEAIAEASEFPIFGPSQGSTRFHNIRSKGPKKGQPAPGSGLAKTEGMDPAAQAEIELLQPYRRGDAFEDDPLWRLQELNRRDKHRILHVVGAHAGGVALNFDRSVNVAGIGKTYVRGLGGPVDGRTQIGRWDGMFPIDPRREMRVNLRPTLNVVFHSATPLVGGAAVIDVLVGVNDYIVGDVLSLLSPFLK
jgi:hypothetical protein